MTEQEQRIAIAEACGWKGCAESPWTKGECVGYPPGTQPCNSLPRQLPDYLHDLNAMQQVVIELICGDKETEKAFLKAFNDCIDGYADSEDVPCICEWEVAMLCAPVWVWAKATLVAIGKWKDQ